MTDAEHERAVRLDELREIVASVEGVVQLRICETTTKAQDAILEEAMTLIKAAAWDRSTEIRSAQ